MGLQLNVKRTGEGPPVVLLHGLFGAGSNLGGLARALRDEFEVFSVDLPNHGRSDWLIAPDLPAMADALLQWMSGQGLTRAHFVGHSLGGKIAMQLALQSAASVAALVVADIAPVAYPPSHDTIFSALNAVAEKGCRSRAEAAALMADYLQDEAMIQFLLSNLSVDGEGIYRWRFDLQGLQAGYPALLAAPQSAQTYTGPVLFIKGADSGYLQDQYWPQIQLFFPAASIKIMSDCGHWLHAEKPQVFNGLVQRFLRSH